MANQENPYEVSRKKKMGDAIIGAILSTVATGSPMPGLMAGGMHGSGRERRARENDLMRDKFDARDDLVGLLSRSSTVERPGMMLDSVDGSAPYQLPGKRARVPTYQTADGQQELMGILARIDPAAAAKAALPNQERANTMEQRIAALREEARRRGYTPDETNKFIDANLGAGTDPMAALALEMQQQRLEAARRAEEEAQREAEREAEDREVEANEYRNNLQSSAENLMELYAVNERLGNDNSALGYLTKSGLPFEQLRRGAASVLNPEAAADVNTFDSLVNQIAIERLKTENFDGNTNARFGAFTKTKPSYEFMGPANAKTIIRQLKGILLADEANNFTLPPGERRKIQNFIDRAESQGVQSLEVGDVEDGYEYMGGDPSDANNWAKQ